MFDHVSPFCIGSVGDTSLSPRLFKTLAFPYSALTHMNCFGQSILKIIGPNTNKDMFVSAIIRAAKMKPVIAQFISYDRFGQGVKAAVSFGHFTESVEGNCCRKSIEESQSISMGDVFDDSQCPHALLEIERSLDIIHVNERFLFKFECTMSQAMNHSFHFSRTRRKLLLNAASRGKIARARFKTFAALDHEEEDNVICIPVVETPNDNPTLLFSSKTSPLFRIWIMIHDCSALTMPMSQSNALCDMPPGNRHTSTSHGRLWQ
jgi:hypothetical protein